MFRARAYRNCVYHEVYSCQQAQPTRGAVVIVLRVFSNVRQRVVVELLDLVSRRLFPVVLEDRRVFLGRIARRAFVDVAHFRDYVSSADETQSRQQRQVPG